MKQEIHPEYHNQTITCVCGATYELGSTKVIEKIDICASCHPFYTGKQREVDSEGRIEKFKKKYGNYADRFKKN